MFDNVVDLLDKNISIRETGKLLLFLKRCECSPGRGERGLGRNAIELANLAPTSTRRVKK